MSKTTKLVHQRLMQLAVREHKFDKAIKLYRLHLTVPKVRQAMKPDYAFISDSNEMNLISWNEVWKSSNIFEAKSQAIYFYQYKKLNRKEFMTIIDWVADCTCWEHSDDLSKIIANVTEENPNWALPVLTKWVKSKKPWQRRQSLTGLIEYSRKRKSFLPFETYINNVRQLLHDEHYYVQKAVGWTLREIYNIYPLKCLSYQHKNLAAITPIAYSAATEKLDKNDKLKINLLRKKLRNGASKS